MHRSLRWTSWVAELGLLLQHVPAAQPECVWGPTENLKNIGLILHEGSQAEKGG